MDYAIPKSLGPYLLDKIIGKGGMGIVYRGTHAETGEVAAIKTIVGSGELDRSGLRREVIALARLSHPGVVRVLGEGLDQSVPWYAMEYLSGPTLRTLLQETPERTTDGETMDRLLRCVCTLCDALAYVHGEGVVHRDLKPGNVALRDDGSPVLVDFGITGQFGARVRREVLDIANFSLGTVLYAAPEQLSGTFVDARADLYSLGVILFEIVAGRLPFRGRSGSVLLAQLYDDPPRPKLFNAQIPDELEDLILRLLAKIPSKRIGYADSVAKVLRRHCRGPAGPEVPHRQAYLYRSSMVGRDAPFNQLLGLLDRGRETFTIAVVSGESGVGKTRLLSELATAARKREMLVLLGECRPLNGGFDGNETRSFPLAGLMGPLSAIVDRCRDRGIAAAPRIFGSRGPILGQFFPSIASLPGQEDFPEPADLPADAARFRLFSAFAGVLGALAEHEKVILVIDDLQWADELTLGCLRFLAEMENAPPVLVVASIRSDERSDALLNLEASLGCLSIALDRLESTDVKGIVADMLALDSPPQDLCRFLSEFSEGNPFFVAEYLHAAVERLLLRRDEIGNWHVERPEGADGVALPWQVDSLPRTLKALVLRRVNGLDPATVFVAQAACVLGRELRVAVLHAVVEADADGTDHALATLERRGVVESLPGGVVRFVHDRIREAINSEIPDARRVDLHLKAAQVLELDETDQSVGHAAKLADHWERAGEKAKAMEWALRGGRLAAKSYVLADAERLYRKHLSLADTITRETVSVRNEFAFQILLSSGRTDDARAELTLVISEARTIGDRAGEGRGLRNLGIAHWFVGDLEQARASYLAALDIARQIGDRRSEGQTLGNLAYLFYDLHDRDEPRRLLDQALALHRETANSRSEVIVLNNIGLVELEAGNLDQAIELLNTARQRAAVTGDLDTLGTSLANLAMAYAGSGDLDLARSCFETALEHHRQCGHSRYEAIATYQAALVERRYGDLDRAEHLGSIAGTLFERTGDLLSLCLHHCETGRRALALGRSATEHLRAAQALADAVRAPAGGEARRAIEGLMAALSVQSNGGTLYRGETYDELPVASRKAPNDAKRTGSRDSGSLASDNN